MTDGIRVRVSQISRITGEDGETAEHRIEASGCLRGRLLSFTETGEDGARIFHRLDFGESGAVTVARTGAIASTVRFAEGERHASVYRIPPYAFDMEVETERLSVHFLPDGVALALDFASVFGGSRQKTALRLTAEPREEAL